MDPELEESTQVKGLHLVAVTFSLMWGIYRPLWILPQISKWPLCWPSWPKQVHSSSETSDQYFEAKVSVQKQRKWNWLHIYIYMWLCRTAEFPSHSTIRIYCIDGISVYIPIQLYWNIISTENMSKSKSHDAEVSFDCLIWLFLYYFVFNVILSDCIFHFWHKTVTVVTFQHYTGNIQQFQPGSQKHIPCIHQNETNKKSILKMCVRKRRSQQPKFLRTSRTRNS